MSEDRYWKITAASQRAEFSESIFVPEAASPVTHTVVTQHSYNIFFTFEKSQSPTLEELKKYLQSLE